VPQMIEGKHEALSTNTSIAKKKNWNIENCHLSQSSLVLFYSKLPHPLPQRTVDLFFSKYHYKLGVVSQACHPSYLGGWALEDHDFRPAWAKKNSWDPISTGKIWA
jgi:hypothetical protein